MLKKTRQGMMKLKVPIKAGKKGWKGTMEIEGTEKEFKRLDEYRKNNKNKMEEQQHGKHKRRSTRARLRKDGYLTLEKRKTAKMKGDEKNWQWIQIHTDKLNEILKALQINCFCKGEKVFTPICSECKELKKESEVGERR